MVSFQKLSLYPETSMLDDMLMYKTALSIADGNWLGNYSYLAMGKHALFSCFLALIIKLNLPYLFCVQVLWITAANVFAISLTPNRKNKMQRLILSVMIMYVPSSYADFTLRVYRDSISTSIFVLTVSGFVGYMLRCSDCKTSKLYGWAILGGICAGCSILIREDGWWILPIAALLVMFAVIIIIKNRKSIFGKLIPVIVSLVLFVSCIGLYCLQNYNHYGLFAVSDLTYGSFGEAYGAMTRLKTDEGNFIVPVPEQSREKLFEISTSFAELKPYLESDEFNRWKKDCGDGKLDYSGGGFYWAIRNAASLAGYYETPQKAQEYWQRIADEVNAYCDSTDDDVLPARNGLNAPIMGFYILPTLKEAVKSLVTVVGYLDLDSSPELSEGNQDLIFEMDEKLHEKALVTKRGSGSNVHIAIWAISDNGSVNIGLADNDGNKLDYYDSYSTGSDIYIDELLSGHDFLYTNTLRHTIITDDFDENTVLTLECSGTKITVPIEECDSVTVEDIKYRIESVSIYSDTSEPDFGTIELWIYRGMRVLCYLWTAIGMIMFLFTVIGIVVVVLNGIKKRKISELERDNDILIPTAFILLVGSALRVGMIAFAEVSAFGIGTYPMYLAAVYPLLLAVEIIIISKIFLKIE